MGRVLAAVAILLLIVSVRTVVIGSAGWWIAFFASGRRKIAVVS